MRRIFRLNLQVLGEALLLLVLTLGITAYFSRKELQEESVRVAEQTLEGTMRDIDNILLSVEQSTGNIYYDLIQHLDNPEMMYEYSRELVKCNPNIVGCAIAFKPGFYPDKDLFMAYVRLKEASKDANSDLVTSEKFTKRPYTEQTWFTEPVNTGRSGWIDPLKGSDTESEPLMTFCLPISDKNEQRVGVLAVDISVKQLSNDIQKAKPSENGYCVLLAHNGSYIVHPSIKKLQDGTTFSHFKKDVDPSEVEAAKAMIAGKKGMKEFRRDNSDWCVFYKPFERAKWEGRLEENTGWSIGVVYPEDDIFGAYNKLLWLVLAIAVAGLTLFFLLSSWIIRKQLKPLKKLVYGQAGNRGQLQRTGACHGPTRRDRTAATPVQEDATVAAETRDGTGRKKRASGPAGYHAERCLRQDDRGGRSQDFIPALHDETDVGTYGANRPLRHNPLQQL